MAPRRAAPVEEVEEAGQEREGSGAVTLQFNEPLSWRPGKPIPTDQLLKRLDRLSKELAEMDQEEVDPSSLLKVSNELVSHQLLTHKDKGVRAYTACCLVDILKLCAPNAPFAPNKLKDIFSLCVNSIIPSVFDPSSAYNNQHKYVLISFAEVKSIVLLLDVEGSDTLLLQLFSTIFDGVSGSKSRAKITKDDEYNMQEILGTLIEEATSLPPKVVDVLMAQFLRAASAGHRHDHVPVDDNQATLLQREEPEAYQIAKNLCNMFPEKMSRFVSQYFSDVIMDATSFAGRSHGQRDRGDSDDEDGPVGPTEGDLNELKKAHRLIREIWRAAPMILQNVVPQVDAELSADNVELRLLATEALGDMISGIGAAGPPPPPLLDSAAYPPLSLDNEPVDVLASNVLTTPFSTQSFSQTHPIVYNNFLSRKNDKTASIRAAWTRAVGYILSTSAGGIGLSREEESTLVLGLGEKLNDSDERVRLAAVKAIESFKFRDIVLQLGPNGGVSKDGSVLSNLADRCRDKRAPVRVEAMSLLARLWGVGTGDLLAGNEVVSAALSAIPSRIFNVFYANDPDLNALLDVVIYDYLVPISFPPPPKKAAKGSHGASQSQSQSGVPSAFDQDAIRAERILLLAQSLDPSAKKAFFALQSRQPQFANIVETFIKQCELYNGGVMDDNAQKKTENLNKTIAYLSRFLADPIKTKSDLFKFAKANDRRNYHLLRYVIGQEHDFKTVHKALRELTKRIQTSKEPTAFDTLLPLLYRSGCFMFNRSHLPTFMDYSKSDKHGLGAIAHEILNEISRSNPELFKAHIGDLCKDLVEQAPTATKANDASVVDSLKACASYSRKFPKEVPVDRNFVQTMSSYALYGEPPTAAKYAVQILLSKGDSKSQASAAELLQKTVKGWEYGGRHFLNKLHILSQLELLAPKAMESVDETVLNICVQQLLLEVRADASDTDPKWVDNADLDEECQAKCLALKILVNRLRSMEDVESAKDTAKATWKLLRSLIAKGGELCKTKDTPGHHKSRLRLTAAKLILKLCTQKHFDDQLSGADFDQLAWMTQDDVMEVRHAFISKLQKYLAEGKLRSRYYTIVFLSAFEPKTDFKHRVETWIRSRARHFEEAKQPVMEAIMARLLSLLAHHPDYSQDLDDLVDHARYLVFYTSLVATEANLGLIYKYAERVKQTKDALYPEWDNHRVLSDLAQAVIRKWQERKNWTFEAYPGKVGLPVGLYIALASHDEAQEVAERQYVPDGIDEKLDELLRAIDRKKKRKSVDDHVAQPPAKRTKPAQKPSSTKEHRESRAAKPAARKQPAPKAKRMPSRTTQPVMNDMERRRSGRSRKSDTKYAEPDTDEDEQEMLEWNNPDPEPENDGSDDDSDHSSARSASSSPAPTPIPKPKTKSRPASTAPVPSAAKGKGSDDSELSDLDSDEVVEMNELESEKEEAAVISPPSKANGRKGSAKAGIRKASSGEGSMTKTSSPKTSKATAAAKATQPASGRSTRLTRRTKGPSGQDEMDENNG